MATNKKYLKPSIKVVEIRESRMLCSSSPLVRCSESCMYWRSCQIKGRGIYCLDKKINNYGNN